MDEFVLKERTTQEFEFIGDPGDDADKEHPPKQPPNIHPHDVIWDLSRHVYYILYNDLRLIRSFRHVFRRDIEDTFVAGKIWTSDICEIALGVECLYFLCREWTLAPKKEVKFDLVDPNVEESTEENTGENKEVPSTELVPKYEIIIVDRQSLMKIGRVDIPFHIHGIHLQLNSKWHIASSENKLLLYAENSDRIHIFVDSKYHAHVDTGFRTKNITGFKIKNDLLVIGTPDNIVSVYKWNLEDVSCKLVVRLPDATDGNFALLGTSVVITRTKYSDNPPTLAELESSGLLQRPSPKYERLRFTDIGTRTTFSKTTIYFKFRIITVASNAKLLLYREDSNELTFKNI